MTNERELTLTELLEYRRRMLLSEVEWIEGILCTEPKTAELRQAWKRDRLKTNGGMDGNRNSNSI